MKQVDSAQMGAPWTGRTVPDPTSTKGRDRASRTRQSWTKWHKLQVERDLISHPLDTPSYVWLLPKPPLPLFLHTSCDKEPTTSSGPADFTSIIFSPGSLCFKARLFQFLQFFLLKLYPKLGSSFPSKGMEQIDPNHPTDISQPK